MSKYIKNSPVNHAKEFWLTNITRTDIGLSDLNLTIRAYTSINILDPKHYYLTPEQIKRSLEGGSLFKRRDKVVVRKVAPEGEERNLRRIPVSTQPIIRPKRTHVEIVERKFEGLDYDDEGMIDQLDNLINGDGKNGK